MAYKLDLQKGNDMKVKRHIFVLASLLTVFLASCSTPSFNLQQGKIFYQEGKYDEALRHFEWVYSNDPVQRDLAWQYLIKSRKALRRNEELPEADAKKEPGLKPEFVCVGEEQEPLRETDSATITATFIEMDLREALLEISTVTGISIVPDDTVRGLVTAIIHEQPFVDALEMLLAANHFSYRRIKNFYLVGEGSPDNPSFDLLSVTCVYRPVHLKPNEVVDLITPYYQRFMTLHEKRGLITIVAPQSIQRRLQRDILALDAKPLQVLLELTILEVSTRGREFLGINWSRSESSPGDGSPKGTSSVLSGGATGIGLNYTVTNLISTQFQATIQWLSETGNATLKATPSIVTLDGHVASFASMHHSWLDLTPNDPGKSMESIRYGVELKIIPHLSRNDEVVLEILTAKVSDLTFNSLGRPEIISHSISNTVRLTEGESLVLGGLLQTKKRIQVTKVPFLGDIPILGVFFKEESESSSETEVLIIIRPKILASSKVALRDSRPVRLDEIVSDRKSL